MVGNRWFKVDLHIHSTNSICFTDNNVTPKQWVLECKKKGLDCVALTDHNSGINIDEYKKAAKEYNLVLFPGVEVTCGENGTHLLILFDVEDTSDVINDFLISIGVKRNSFGNSKPGTTKTVLDVIQIANNRDKMVIPAHIDEFNGLAYLDNILQEKILNGNEIQAVQVVQPEFLNTTGKSIPRSNRTEIYKSVNKRYGDKIGSDTLDQWYKTFQKAWKSNKTLLTFSDNPESAEASKHGLWGIGTRFTLIKMSKNPSISSLKEALLLGNQRVKNDLSTIPSHIGTKKVWLEELTISNTIENDQDIVVNFSSDLTTIIGGRGTGKSFITRLLAFALDKGESLELFSEVKKDFENFAKISDGTSGVFTSETEIKLILTFEDVRYRISKTLNTLVVESIGEDGSWQIEPNQRYNQISNSIDIYLQKQIFEMANNQGSIRDFLDKYCQIQILPIQENINEIKAQIKQLFQNVLKESTLTEKKQTLDLAISDLNRSINKLDNPSFKEIVNKKSRMDSEKKFICNDVDDFKNQLLEQKKIQTSDILNQNVEHLPDDIKNLRKNLTLYFKEQREHINKIYDDIDIEVKNYEKNIRESQWYQLYDAVTSEYNQLKDQLDTDEFTQLSNLSKMKIELEKKVEERNEIIGTLDKVKVSKQNIEEKFIELNALYEKLYTTRKTFIENNIKDLQVNLQKQGDFSGYIHSLRGILGKENVYDTDFENIEKKLSLNEGNPDKITVKNVYDDIAGNISEDNLQLFSNKKLRASFSELSPDVLLAIRTLVPADKISINLNVNGRIVNLTNASAGQKTSAILSMILSLGDNPLVMDQPEDDLDSQLINNLIVKSMIQKKGNRQLIVVTHNPNIPVNGDAEWVISMGNSSHLTVDATGSIDDQIIKDKICGVMEGGKDAFTNRAVRYGFN